jgi:hypothetical protein
MAIKRFPKLIPYVNGNPHGIFPSKTKKTYSYQVINASEVEWRENKPFDASIRFLSVGATYSGTVFVQFCATDNEERIYDMRADTFNELLKNATMILGTYLGRFVFERSGNNMWLAPTFLMTAENTE